MSLLINHFVLANGLRIVFELNYTQCKQGKNLMFENLSKSRYELDDKRMEEEVLHKREHLKKIIVQYS